MRFSKNTECQKGDDEDGVSPVIGVILMVAITVILAAVIGTFVLGLGDNISSTANAGLEVQEDENSLTISFVSSGNLDGAKVVGPNGAQSMNLGDAAQAGTRIVIHDNLSTAFNTTNTSAGEDLVDGENCIVRHGLDDLHDVEVNGADIGCSGTRLVEIGASDSVSGSEIEFEKGAEYQVLGIVNGEENVIRTIETEEL